MRLRAIGFKMGQRIERGRRMDEVSTEFLLRLAPVRHRDDRRGDSRRFGRPTLITPEEIEFELEASASGQVLSLHFHGSCYDQE
jgi:hypothetical protein